MDNWLLEDIGNELAKKPFERVFWWRETKWNVFISIDSPLTIDKPLWLREENNLRSLRLFYLHPNELQKEIIHFWQQPFWKRWLLDLFTSIRIKIKLWSYYQRCLAFREIYIKNPYDEKEPIDFVFEQYLGREARYGLKKCRIQFENYFEKHTGNLKWIKNNKFFIDRHFKKDWDYFVKLMNKKLTQLFSESDRNGFRSQLEKEYMRLQDILFRYLSTWSINIFDSFISKGTSISNALVYVDSVESQTNDQPMSELISNEICSLRSIDTWIKRKRQTIKSMLQEESSKRFIKIENLFESYLFELNALVASQLRHYKKMIDKVRWNQYNCDDAGRQTEIILTDLIYFFRKSVLLFHPDKSFGNEKLQEIQTKLFIIFQKLSNESLEKIKEGLSILQACLLKQKKIQEFWKLKLDFDLRTAKMEKQIKELRLSFNKIKIEYTQDFVNRKADLKEVRIEMEKTQIKIDECIRSQARSKLIQNPPSNTLMQKENEIEGMRYLECNRQL